MAEKDLGCALANSLFSKFVGALQNAVTDDVDSTYHRIME